MPGNPSQLVDIKELLIRCLSSKIIIKNPNQMTIKGEEKAYKLGNYEIIVNQITDKKVQIQAVDTEWKIEFAQDELVLENIGVSTLILALEGSKKQVSIATSYKMEEEIQILELKVTVESPFIKTIEESLYIKKFRDVEENQILDARLKSLNQKLKLIKENNDNDGKNVYSYFPDDKHFMSSGFETISSIKLKEGKYLITLSFLLKANNQWIYLYMNKAGVIKSAESGFYVPTTTEWMPFTVRFIKSVNSEEQEITFDTMSANSYQIHVKNQIITAKRIPETAVHQEEKGEIKNKKNVDISKINPSKTFGRRQKLAKQLFA